MAKRDATAFRMRGLRLVAAGLGLVMLGWARAEVPGGTEPSPARGGRVPAEVVQQRAMGQAGQQVPGREDARWARGTGFDEAEGKRARAVVVWSAACGPSLASLPAVAAATAKWPVVTVLWSEQAGDTAARRDLVAGMDERLRLRVLVDDEANSVGRPWLTEVAGEVSWPSAFVVDAQGRVAWIGHPMAGLVEALEWVSGPEYSPESARARTEAELAEAARAKPMWTAFWAVADNGTPEAMEAAAEQLRGVGPDTTMASWLRLVQAYAQRGDGERALGAARRFEAARAEMGSGLARSLGWRVWATVAAIGVEVGVEKVGATTEAAVGLRREARPHLEGELTSGVEHLGVLSMLAWCRADTGDSAGAAELLDRAAVFRVTARQREAAQKQRAAVLAWAAERKAAAELKEAAVVPAVVPADEPMRAPAGR
jgi:hypothetical protein